MAAGTGTAQSPNYFASVFELARLSVVQLLRPPSQPRRAAAARRLRRQISLLAAMSGAAILVLMVAVDVPEIGLMPPRGAAALWPVRVLTDFGRSANVLWLLAATLLAVALVSPRWPPNTRSRLLRFGMRLEFIFFAVLVPVLGGEIIKWFAGRGRPFVGGKADAFNFAPFAGTEAHFSFPSGHAVTGFALAFAVAAVWPRARGAMMAYAILIAATRLVLLAHHPSDVVAGALIGVIGAMLVRYWFAVRGLGFAVASNGAIVPLAGPAIGPGKGVAGEASAP